MMQVGGSRAEMPPLFEMLVVHGKNWRQYPPRHAPPGWKLRLSIESKLSALAAGELYRRGLVGRIIFSTGKTAGKKWPSEAQAMWVWLRRRYPDIPEEVVELEEGSYDTAGNAEWVARMLRERGIQTCAFLTVGFHLPRAKRLLATFGVRTVAGFASEEVVMTIFPAHRRFVERWLSSKRVQRERRNEALLCALLLFDPKGKLLDRITRLVRHQ